MDCFRDNFYEGVVLDGRFETVSPLNHGSFGMVFMARDLTNNEFVAIKCLTKKSASSDCEYSFAVDERSEELECHAVLGDHPNTVNLIHSFETDAHIYVVLEFCSRGDLYEAIRSGTGPLETEHVREFMHQLLDAVEYIHSKGMYHRDIKPENIFITQSGAMKLGDFGLATSEKWTEETKVGSDRYMAPEQFDSDGAGYASDKADVWAIGICLLNVLFGKNPFGKPDLADKWFYDFSRDKQVLFDIFPTMSQDTFEVVAPCLSLDPRKRSLQAVREALERVVSFTTDDESLDDFENAERRGIASAHREPLRTPSIQSPQVDSGSFPWAQAIRTSPPRQIRRLSAIPDDESYLSEDLFPISEEGNKDWFSVGQQTPSMASTLGASMNSLAVRRVMGMGPPKATLTPISGSLPITMSKAKPLPSMSSIFGGKKTEVVSKSWSDLWDEDIEEEEEEAEKQIKARQLQNARTWSHESKSEDDMTRQIPLEETQQSSFVNIPQMKSEAGHATVTSNIDEDLVADGFFFHDVPKNVEPQVSPRYSPPPKRNSVDKWSALGERRRAYTGASEAEKSPELWKARRTVGLGFSGFGASVWDSKANTVVKDRDPIGAKAVHLQSPNNRVCPWTNRDRVRDHHFNISGKDKRQVDLGDLEWVGGWNDLHL